MNSVSIHQPNYLPWLGYFYKIYLSDTFVFLDDAQYSNQGMHNYTYIKTTKGSYRLKYPVKQSLGDKINEVRAKDELKWKEKHLEIIKSNYYQTKYFELVYNDYKKVIIQEYKSISELNASLIILFSNKLGIKVKYEYSSDLGIDLVREEKIIAICKALQVEEYISGKGARAYQNEESFSAVGLKLRYSDFIPFQYDQQWGEFQSNVSALDYFMNCGYDWDGVIKGIQSK